MIAPRSRARLPFRAETADATVGVTVDELPAPPRLRLGRALVVLAALAVLIAAVGAFYLTRGEPNVGLGKVLSATFGGERDDAASFLIAEVRLPRMVLALLAGAGLGLAGVILQDMLMNPIADPSLLGMSDAAALVIAVLLVFPGAIPDVGVPVLCLIAGLSTGVVLVAIARSVRDPVYLVLVGVLLSMLYGTMTAIVLLLAPSGFDLSRFVTFTAGSVSSGSWARVGDVWPWMAVAVPLTFAAARTLNLLQLGDDLATGLGVRVTRARCMLFFIAMLLVAPIVAVTGPIAFVALFCPHVARLVLSTGNTYAVLPVSAATGAAVVLIADALGRLLFFPREIPAGLWTIAIVGPAAILMARSRLRASASGMGSL